jgi:hypothetical protein
MFLTEELNRKVTALKKSRLKSKISQFNFKIEEKEEFFNLLQLYNDSISRSISDKLFTLLNKQLITANDAAGFILALRESFVEFTKNHQTFQSSNSKL